MILIIWYGNVLFFLQIESPSILFHCQAMIIHVFLFRQIHWWCKWFRNCFFVETIQNKKKCTLHLYCYIGQLVSMLKPMKLVVCKFLCCQVHVISLYCSTPLDHLLGFMHTLCKVFMHSLHTDNISWPLIVLIADMKGSEPKYSKVPL